MAMNAGSREPRSLSMARRVSSCVVSGPGVNKSGGWVMAARQSAVLAPTRRS